MFQPGDKVVIDQTSIDSYSMSYTATIVKERLANNWTVQADYNGATYTIHSSRIERVS